MDVIVHVLLRINACCRAELYKHMFGMSQPIHMHSHELVYLSTSCLTMGRCVLLQKAQHLHVFSICMILQQNMLAKDNKH